MSFFDSIPFDLANPWLRMAGVILAGFLVHFALKILVFPLLQKAANRTSNDLDDRLLMFLRRFLGIVVWFLVFVFCLKAHGIEITALLASAGIVGIAIGLAAKETLADILSGIFIITDQPIRTGDRILLDRIGAHWGGWGDVVEIGLRRTKIRNPDGVVVNYPNSTLATSVITNFSEQKGGGIRARIRFQLNYEEDIDAVIALSEEVINSTDQVVEDTAEVVVRSLWDEESGALGSGVLMEGRYKIRDVRERTRIRSRVLANLLRVFRERDIHFGHAVFKVADE